MGHNPYRPAITRKIRHAIWVFTPFGPVGYRTFHRTAKTILLRRSTQSAADVARLTEKYRNPVFGPVTLIELLEKMRRVTDPTDTRLGNANQLTHTLQALESMEDEGIVDPDLRQALLLHDLGKLLFLVNEAPENVFGTKEPIGKHAPGVGLDRVSFQWNHDDLVYERFRDRVSEPVAWLLRFHSINIPRCEIYMDHRDRAYTQTYLHEFQFHDQNSKSMFKRPKHDLEFYREWIETSFPDPIIF